MSKFLIIMKNEYSQIVKKKSFIIGLLLTPILMGVFMLLPAYLARKAPSTAESLAVIDASGYGIGQKFAASLERYTLEDTDNPSYVVKKIVTVDSGDEKAFHRNLDSLRNAVSDQQIKYLVVFESDPAVSDTNVFVVTNSDNYYTLGRFEARISRIVSERRLARSDVNLPVDSVLALTRGLDLRTQDTKGERVSSEVKLFGSIIFVMLIYLMILTYGATLMRSVIEEKNSRIIEVIVSSVSPFQLMLGKIAGMALAALTTVTIWIAMGLALVMYSGSISLEIDPAIMNVIFNPLVVSGFALFLVFGFVLYSAFFAFIGSIVNTDKESQNFMWPVVLMLMVPVLTGSTVIRDPFTPWAVALSYLPPFAPTMMVMRIMFIAPTATGYSLFSGILGEMVLSLIILIVFTVFFIWVVGRIFRVGIFMYGKRPTLSEIVKWVRY